MAGAKHRHAIDREVEMDFPQLPPGCSIQLDRQSREYVLRNIRENLKNLKLQVPDLARLRKSLIRAAFINGPIEAVLLRRVILPHQPGTAALGVAGNTAQHHTDRQNLIHHAGSNLLRKIWDKEI